MIEGFRFTVDPKANNQVLPMNRRMFFRHSMVECLPTAQASAGGSTSQQEVGSSCREALHPRAEDSLTSSLGRRTG